MLPGVARGPFALLIVLASLVHGLKGELLDQECPIDCHCHYFRINWVTDCSESNLTTIPHEGLSQNVYILDVNGNNVERIEPFPRDIKLRRLQVAHNRLTEIDHDSFAGLTYLLDADFSYNAISKVDPDAFRDSPGLITLELQHNPLEEIKDNFLNCRPLFYLDLNTCGIRHLNPKFFHNTTNLNKLDLSYNPLGSIKPGPFDHLTNLEYLKLTSCNLTHISPEAFAHLENLRELEMEDNDLSGLDWTRVIAPLVRLERLNIRKTRITNLPGDAFAKNLYLRQLVLADNEFQHLNVGSTLGHNLHSLQSLDLSNCNLQDRLSEQAFRNASKLRMLDLSGNPMFAADLTAVLRHLPKLHKLSLSNCSLHRLPEAFEDLEYLEELDISHNPLSDAFVKLLKPLKSLVYLDMSYCNLGYVGKHTFSLMTSLKKLIMSGNKLHTIEFGLLANLTSLESFELSDCNMQYPLDSGLFDAHYYPNIIEVKFSNNYFGVMLNSPLLPKQMSGVEIVDLSYSQIRQIDEYVLSNLKNLTHLNLSHNNLTDMRMVGTLKKLQTLQYLDLSNNNLTTVHPDDFKENPHLLSVNLIGNPFVCSCSIVEMWNWALQVKNDLDVLVGSQPSQFTTTAAKLRRSLSCTYDAETYRRISEQSRVTTGDRRTFLRKADLTPTRTWAKYIRESQCDRLTNQ